MAYQSIGIAASIGFLCKANQPSLILTLHCFERLSRKEIEGEKEEEKLNLKCLTSFTFIKVMTSVALFIA